MMRCTPPSNPARCRVLLTERPGAAEAGASPAGGHQGGGVLGRQRLEEFALRRKSNLVLRIGAGGRQRMVMQHENRSNDLDEMLRLPAEMRGLEGPHLEYARARASQAVGNQGVPQCSWRAIQHSGSRQVLGCA